MYEWSLMLRCDGRYLSAFASQHHIYIVWLNHCVSTPMYPCIWNADRIMWYRLRSRIWIDCLISVYCNNIDFPSCFSRTWVSFSSYMRISDINHHCFFCHKSVYGKCLLPLWDTACLLFTRILGHFNECYFIINRKKLHEHNKHNICTHFVCDSTA